MQIIYQDKRILIAVKPAGVASVDEPGGMPSLLREYLGDPKACVRTVHRLDQAVSGLMVFARSRAAAAILSEQIRSGKFHKTYLAVTHGVPEQPEGEMRDLLLYSRSERRSQVVMERGKDVQEALLNYRCISANEAGSLLRICLKTGRTHQIRVQLSSRGIPIFGDRKYGVADTAEKIALWSYKLEFCHPETDELVTFKQLPPDIFPWNQFSYSALG